MKKWILVFIYSFGLNLIWENVHQFLYLHNKGKEITELVLIQATLFDALIILGLIFILRLFLISRRYPSILIFAGIFISIFIEYWALGIGRWEYNNLMPIIPFLNVGVTPTIQLGLIGYLVYRIIFKEKVS